MFYSPYHDNIPPANIFDWGDAGDDEKDTVPMMSDLEDDVFCRCDDSIPPANSCNWGGYDGDDEKDVPPMLMMVGPTGVYTVTNAMEACGGDVGGGGNGCIPPANIHDWDSYAGT